MVCCNFCARSSHRDSAPFVATASQSRASCGKRERRSGFAPARRRPNCTFPTRANRMCLFFRPCVVCINLCARSSHRDFAPFVATESRSRASCAKRYASGVITSNPEEDASTLWRMYKTESRSCSTAVQVAIRRESCEHPTRCRNPRKQQFDRTDYAGENSRRSRASLGRALT